MLGPRRLTNCVIVAVTIWIKAWRLKPYIYGRRSFSFGGTIPHTGAAYKVGFRRIAVIEACPPKSDLWTSRNVALLFDPTYRVWIMRPESVARYETLGAAMDAAKRINR